MKMNLFLAFILALIANAAIFAQPPGRGQGRPDGPMRRGDDGPQQGGRPPKDDWLKRLDTNGDGNLDSSELQAAIETSFKAWDANGNGTIEMNEMPRPGRPDGRGNRPQGPPMGQAMRPEGRTDGQGEGPHGGGQPGDKMLPPFFFADRNSEGMAVSRAEFERIVRSVFAEMDKNGDGVLSGDELRPPRREGQGPGRPEGPPPPPNGKFIAAELRFGDKLVKGQPFSADTVIEDTRRLYDGTTVTKQLKGAFYRDGAGRTRREQPLEMVGGVSIAGSDGKPQTLVFINDFAAHTQYFLDANNKVASKHGIAENPLREPAAPPDARTESLGSKTIEGVQTEGTRVIFEIPPGQIGNDKPIQVITENWFSPELQMIVLSKHVDPLAGEHVFRLVNIKRSEPSADLFSVPAGYRVEAPPERGGRQ